MRPKYYTFFTIGKDGKPYFPKETGTSQIQLIDTWTLNILEAVYWDELEPVKTLASEFNNVCIVTMEKHED